MIENDPLHPHLQHLTQEDQYEIMERAAIIEYSGKMTRQEAEMEATGGIHA
jgi:hypothetical protein